MMGNVKAFILMICSGVVFATLLVFREHHGNVDPRENAGSGVLKTLGFTGAKWSLGPICLSEAVALSLAGGLIGFFPGWIMIYGLTHSKQSFLFSR